MKTYQKLFAAFLAVCFMTVSAFAADASPAGTWKFTAAGRGGNPGTERTLMLDVKDGKLTGTLKGTTGGQFEIPDAAIEEASFKDGMVAFAVTTDFNGTKRTTKYSGKLEGEKITGSTERPGRDGAMQKTDWAAMRAK
ncbi:MAG: hypothetical protein ABIZ81_16280 [Opitutaceae bacterium]